MAARIKGAWKPEDRLTQVIDEGSCWWREQSPCRGFTLFLWTGAEFSGFALRVIFCQILKTQVTMCSQHTVSQSHVEVLGEITNFNEKLSSSGVTHYRALHWANDFLLVESRRWSRMLLPLCHTQQFLYMSYLFEEKKKLQGLCLVFWGHWEGNSSWIHFDILAGMLRWALLWGTDTDHSHRGGG